MDREAVPGTPSSVDESALYERRRALFDGLAARPWDHDFFGLLRTIDALWPASPRLGTALRPSAEPVRFGQEPDLSFAPAAVMSFEARETLPPRVGVRFFGLFGPMGPLPLHITEHARDRLRNHGDATFARFADVFHHRMLALFYRAWAQAQPTVQADRPHDDRYAKWVAALFGNTTRAPRADAVPEAAKRFVSGHLARSTRNVESIEKILRQYFSVPIRVESNVGHWMLLRRQDRSALATLHSGGGAQLGRNAIAGTKVWDRQYKLRLHVGPLTLAEYRRFLPGRSSLVELRGWLRQFLGFEMLWDLRLVLRAAEVPPLQLGAKAGSETALGLTTWLGRRAARSEPGTLYLNPAQLPARRLHQKGEDHG
jgi:type VI secretion system protein ImpH